jgi:AICAR transformylase/IMP cyclohydrolase PurH
MTNLKKSEILIITCEYHSHTKSKLKYREVDGILLAQDSSRWRRALMNAVMNLRVP